MRLPARASMSLFALGVGSLLVLAQDGPGRRTKEQREQDEYEEKVVLRIVERATKAAETEQGRWLLELNKAFPDRAGRGRSEEEIDRWFGLLAGGGREWRRDAAPTKGVAELFDRVARKLELGPVPSIRRDEFREFARQFLLPEKPPPGKPGESAADADKLFRVLDRDASGSLEDAEWTDRLREASGRADTNTNGRIDRDEYRVYFRGRVSVAIGLAADRTADRAAGGNRDRDRQSDQKASAARLPRWFGELDADADGQVGLYEWRKAGLPVTQFTEMDLDGDGLLPPAEYLRYAKQHPGGVPVELGGPKGGKKK